MWAPFEMGHTIGAAGSESGIITHDEEHRDGARITLERAAVSAPFAITCGIYGCMVHTRYFGLEAEATQAFEDMKQALDRILQCEAETGEMSNKIEQFFEHYP
jgi:hypothetical protein